MKHDPASPVVGLPAADIPTPALVVDVEAMERNLIAMSEYAARHGVRLRPHAKTHKSSTIAQQQVQHGAVGVCVQKLSEALALADGGVGDIFISNVIVDEAKLERLAALARRTRMAVAVDSVLGVDRLAAAFDRAGTGIDVFVEIDVGQGRCGVAPAAAASLARRVVEHGLRFAGLQAYHGGAQHVRTVRQRADAVCAAAACVDVAKQALAGAGLACPRVTGGGTGTFALDTAHRVWDELQCGSYLFMDRDYADNEAVPDAPRFEQALFVKTQVVSVSAGRAVVDAGHKSHAIDSGMPAVWQRAWRYENGGDEHGILRRSDADENLPALGEVAWLIPGHCDPTVNLHDRYVVVRGGLHNGHVEALWAIDARGCVV